jgi:adenosylcobinamide-GDP ribazoletransferase
MNAIYRRILIAFQFLTIIPLRVRGEISEKEIGEASAFFPLVGAFQGALLITAHFILVRGFPTELTNAFLVLLLALSNGGFHLDGLADTFDAIAVKSGGNRDIDRQKRLSIMKNSTIGSIGVVAIVLALLLKFLALNSLFHFSPFTFSFSLFLMPVLPKWTMVISMFHGKPARANGLGRLFIIRTGFREIAISSLILLLLFMLAQVFFSPYTSNITYIFYAVLLVTMYFFSRAGVVFFSRKFGGLTGDTVGALSEITEIIFLLTVIVWSRLSI